MNNHPHAIRILAALAIAALLVIVAKAGVPLGWATGAMFAVRSASSIAKPFVLGALLVTGQTAVIIIGAYCLVCAAAFALTTHCQW